MASNITTMSNFKWVIGGGFLLSMNAGFIGALSLAGMHRATVSHVSGDVIRTGVYLVNHEWNSFLNVTLVWIFFIFGSSISSLMVSGTKQFSLKRVYGLALLIESVWLFLSYVFSVHPSRDSPIYVIRASNQWWLSEYFAAVALGMQNAICTNYSGAILRTTHVTGCCTDIGLVLGHEFRIRYGLRMLKYARSIKERYILKYQILVEDEEMSEVSKSRKNILPPVPNPPVVVSSNEITPSPRTPTSTPSFPLPSNTTATSSATPTSPNPTASEPSIMWKLKVLLPLLFGYIFGALIGANAFHVFRSEAILFPMGFVGLIGFVYSASVHVLYKRIKDKLPPLSPLPLTRR